MKATLFALFVALLMVGCGEEAKYDPSVPLAIPCVACDEKVSKKTEKCLQCGHPTPDSVVAYKAAQEEKRIWRKRRYKEERLAAIKAMEEAKAQAKHIGLDDYTIILNAVIKGEQNLYYTGWLKELYVNGQVFRLRQYKKDHIYGLEIAWYENGQKSLERNWKIGSKVMSAESWKPNGEKCPVTNVKDGNGVLVWYNEDGTEESRETYKDGYSVED